MTGWKIERTGDRLALRGELTLVDAAAIWRSLRAHVDRAIGTLELDLASATAIDGATLGLLADSVHRLRERGVEADLVGAPAHLAPMVALYRAGVGARRAPTSSSSIERLGAAADRGIGRVRDGGLFAGELATWIGRALRRPGVVTWKALPALVERAGSDGVPIVLLLNFLVGFVMAFQSMQPLQAYGANIYVADIVGISVTRELAPLMTAIIMSGRSGAAYAAELGAMRVSDEIDALRSMGFSPIPHLVLPRVAALALAAPVLTLLGDVVGTVGGLVVGVTSLDVTPRAYLAELRLALVASDVWTGLVKSVAFGAAIAILGCGHGLLARGAATGVGRSTTSTVVACLFVIVVLDTMFTVLFRGLGV